MDKIDKNSELFLSIPVHSQKLGAKRGFFRSISVHFFRSFSYLCTGFDNITSTTMAGTVKEMSLMKQVLQLKQLGECNRGISRKLSINKETSTSTSGR